MSRIKFKLAAQILERRCKRASGRAVALRAAQPCGSGGAAFLFEIQHGATQRGLGQALRGEYKRAVVDGGGEHLARVVVASESLIGN